MPRKLPKCIRLLKGITAPPVYQIRVLPDVARILSERDMTPAMSNSRIAIQWEIMNLSHDIRQMKDIGDLMPMPQEWEDLGNYEPNKFHTKKSHLSYLSLKLERRVNYLDLEEIRSLLSSMSLVEKDASRLILKRIQKSLCQSLKRSQKEENYVVLSIQSLIEEIKQHRHLDL